MALTKVTYIDGVTVIGADNLNAIQDEIISNTGSIETLSEDTQEALELIEEDVESLSQRVADIESNEGLYRYGVSGINNSSPTLTRLWDSVGMTARVGTDSTSVVNDFDTAKPFMRKKCVGKWYTEGGRPVFKVNAYYGDADYTEDGSMGDYVAVECPLCFYYMKDGTLGISAHQYEGWQPFDIFCHDHNPNDLMEKVYLPAYALAVKDGHAVSLPDLDNEQGAYNTLLATAKTYDGDGVQSLAVLQPAAVNFYEWALFTVEFATMNCQSIMQGCSGLRHNAADTCTFTSASLDTVLVANYNAGRVVGEYVAIVPSGTDINAVAYRATHKILSVTRCDSTGTPSSSGTYSLVTLEDLGKGYVTYDTSTTYIMNGRPYRTGACNGVLTPSGSPVSNTDTFHPMRYRYRENVFGNQYKTVMDLFNVRVADGSSYHLDWYYLPDVTKWTSGNPSATDLAGDDFVLLDVGTEVANYANGYIKSKKYSSRYPDIWIPYLTSGGSASTYFCDYAYLVSSNAVRSVRFGGSWNIGAIVGFSYAAAHAAPSAADAFFGGDLCFAQ